MSFGGSANHSDSKNTSTGQDTQNGTTDFTESPVLPDWISNAAHDIFSGGSVLAGANPASYVAGPNSLLTTAGANATNLSGTPWDYDAAEQATGAVSNAKAPDISSYVSRFMDPYLSSVVDATGADLDHQAGLTRAQDDLNLAASGAFGGSGAALTKSATEGELARARATALGGLRSQGFTQALGAATSQAQLQQQQQQQRLNAAAQMAGIADQYGANSRANIAAQDAAAAPLQAIAQSQASAPLDLESWLAQIFAGAQPGLFQGQTGTQTQKSTENQNSSGTGSSTGFSVGVKVPVGG